MKTIRKLSLNIYIISLFALNLPLTLRIASHFLQNGNYLWVEDGLNRRYLRKASEARKHERKKQRRQLYQLYNEDEEMRKLELQGDRYGIIAAMFMQDGPFLILRLYLVFKYDF